MPHPAAALLAPNHAFNQDEYAAAVGLAADDPAVAAMLARHVRAGEIKHIAEGVFYGLPEGCEDPDGYPEEPVLVAPRLRPGSVIAYGSALDFQGYPYSITSCQTTSFSPAGNERIVTDAEFYHFYEPTGGIVLERGADGVGIITFLGVDVLVTTVERTLADLFARPFMRGSTLLDSLESVVLRHDLDAAALVRHLLALGDAPAAGAAGFWLETVRVRWGRPRAADAELAALRAIAPREPAYALGAREGRRGGSVFADGWNVFVPERFLEPEIHGIPMFGT